MSFRGFVVAGLTGVLLIAAIELFAKGPRLGLLLFVSASAAIVVWASAMRVLFPAIFVRAGLAPVSWPSPRQRVIPVALSGILLPLAITVAAGLMLDDLLRLLVLGAVLATPGVVVTVVVIRRAAD